MVEKSSRKINEHQERVFESFLGEKKKKKNKEHCTGKIIQKWLGRPDKGKYPRDQNL